LSINPKVELENLAKLHQMKINSRLVSLETSLKLMHIAGYAQANDANKLDAITLIAQAQMFEQYILGNIEEESVKALEEAAKKLGGPRIVRP
jgi:hypothetical protein